MSKGKRDALERRKKERGRETRKKEERKLKVKSY